MQRPLLLDLGGCPARVSLKNRGAAPRFNQAVNCWRGQRRANVSLHEDPNAAAADADVLYTDVWVSMGKESESAYRIAQLERYQINETLLLKRSPAPWSCIASQRTGEKRSRRIRL